MQGRFRSSGPLGVILHGSRGGANTLDAEYTSTRNYAAGGANGLGWNATIGQSIYAVHISAAEWGWNAREHSDDYLAAEFAQPTVNDAISDEQVAAFADWFTSYVHPAWPLLDLRKAGTMPMHSELVAGQRDRKTDVFGIADPRGDELRQRIIRAVYG